MTYMTGSGDLAALHCTLYSMYTVHCTVYIVQFTVYSVQCAMNIVQCTVYNVQCTLYTVHSSSRYNKGDLAAGPPGSSTAKSGTFNPAAS